MRVISYGEAMLRFAPVGDSLASRGRPSAASPFTRSVGGDELNVCVALARLGVDAAWASVLPAGPLGDVVRSCAADAGVRLDHLRTLAGQSGEVGTYHLLPEEGRVHYQRRHSAFGTQPPGLFQWASILAEEGKGGTPLWVHMTGITPMLGKQAAACWTAALHAADSAAVPVSVDLNYRPQLGSFADLWRIVEHEISRIHLLILSTHSSHTLADHLGVCGQQGEGDVRAPPAKRVRAQAGAVSGSADGTTEQLVPILHAIHERLGGPAIACCLKERDGQNKQKRWSILIDGDGFHSTESMPTIHMPKDECGGGSAWAAGLIDALGQDLKACAKRQPGRNGSSVTWGKDAVAKALRNGDILAALAQESAGDHSTATRDDLEIVKAQFHDVAAVIDGLPALRNHSTAACRAIPDEDAASARIEAALQRLEDAKVIAILRAKNETRAVERAIELADLGYRAIEVTADSAGFAAGRLLPAVATAVGDRCLVGIGTVMNLDQLEKATADGAHFALSPVRPTAGWGAAGFVRECHKRGVLAMPAAFTPQEIYECVEEHGALTVKIFPAQLWSPSALQDLRRIGDFGRYRLCPSGGITCSTAEAWLAAGAAAVGMGSCLVGKDIAAAPGDMASLSAAEQEWCSKAKLDAAALARRLLLTPV